MARKSKAGSVAPEAGMVVAIPLSDGRFAYAKLFRGGDFGVYDFLSSTPATLVEVTAKPFLYHQFGSDEPVRQGAWPVLGIEPFADNASSWGPPQAGGVYPGMDLDPIMLQILHRGELRRASVEEVQGLDIAWVCQTAGQFVDVLLQRLVARDHHGRRVGA